MHPTEPPWYETTAKQRCENAIRLIEEGERLTARQWACWIWTMTGIATASLMTGWRGNEEVYCKHESGPNVGKYIVTVEWTHGPHFGQTALVDVATIAGKNSKWTTASGGDMQRWVLLLADESDRATAMEALGLLYDPDAQPLLPPQRAAKVRAQVAAIAGRHAIPAVPMASEDVQGELMAVAARMRQGGHANG